ncbi:hypothetical protein BHM03_00044863 [Ensete ventricosum]|nr:hypothetical protein BHM03_00044863 [Ensete ventricosum]
MPSSTHDAPTTQPGAVGEADQPSKKMKVLVSKPPSSATIVIPVMTAPRKETPALTVREKEAAPHGEGSSRRRDKAMSWPRSMRDLCMVRAHSRDEPFLAQEIVDLPELSGHIRLKLAGPHRGWCRCTSCSTEAPLPPTSEGGLHHSF